MPYRAGWNLCHKGAACEVRGQDWGGAMNWIVIGAAFLALIGAHLLRAPGRTHLFGAIIPFLIGLVAAAIAIKAVTQTADFGLTTPFDGFVNQAVITAKEDDAPLIIFSGASFSRNAVDEVRLTEALRKRGFPHRVVSLSLEAASLVERDTHLQAYISQAPNKPALVFWEIAETTDKRPTFIFGNSKFSVRAIDQFDPRGTVWAATGLAGGGCAGAVDCVKESGFLATHAALNAVNVGLIGQGDFTRNAPPMRAFEGPLEPREEIAPADRQKQLATATEIAPADGLKWAMNFRALQRARLQQDGISVAYYFPPVIDPAPRAFAANVCAGELKAFKCIAPTDPALLQKLDGDYWLDGAHLLDPGAVVYTEWLADQIVASGVLEASR